eukprot:GHVS01010225.1.p1 GENE.GHVS01010225.1~~GHVS01010225.1.p1  ORF type:complete len:153 (+),score=16.89 GHVS01010225.1:175-633(+)
MVAQTWKIVLFVLHLCSSALPMSQSSFRASPSHAIQRCPAVNNKKESDEQEEERKMLGKGTWPLKANEASQRSTDSCPFCSEGAFDEVSLVTHCVQRHADFDGQRKTCPICLRNHRGDASFSSRNLLQHLQLRHCFRYSDAVRTVVCLHYTQ